MRKRRKSSKATRETGEVFNILCSFKKLPDIIQKSTASDENRAVKAVEKGIKKQVAITANAPAWVK